MKICQFGAGSQKYEERVQNSAFSHDIILKQNCIVIFMLFSFINICQNYIGLYECVSRSSVHF